MQTVWKFPVPVKDDFEIPLPSGARVLSVQIQQGEPCLWALVDPEKAIEPRRFRLSGTGHPIKDGESLNFVGSFQMHGGALVFHLFERF